MTGSNPQPASGARKAATSQTGSIVEALLEELERSQWMPADALAAYQFRRLGVLAGHLERQSAFFQRRLEEAGLRPGDLAGPDGLRRLPPMTRRSLQAATDLYCRELPEGHAPVSDGQTSGSTGEPVRFRRTHANQIDWLAFTIREHLWHRRDAGGSLCTVRAETEAVERSAQWGAPIGLLYDTGPRLAIPITTDVSRQVELIGQFAPTYLMTYPSNLAALLAAAGDGGGPLRGIRSVRTVGETASDELRSEVRRVLGCELVDLYSSREFGYLALQCPDHGGYHVMAEAVIVEILDDDGLPCATGQTGRVTITDLRNFSTPLVRYDIGDYAEVGAPCPCGRGLPAIARIRGRERNLVRFPDGRRHWPLVGFAQFRDLAPVLQYQLVQTSLDALDVRLVTSRPPTADEERALGAHIQASLGHPFRLSFHYFEREIPRGANRKLEEFVSLLP